MSKPYQLSDNENEDDKELQHVIRQSRDACRDEELRRSHTVGRSGGDSCQTLYRSYTVEKSTRVDDDFDTYATGRIDSYMQKLGYRAQLSIKSAMKGIKDVKKHIDRAIAKFFFSIIFDTTLLIVHIIQ